MNKLSKIFQPISATNVNTNGISKDIISKSQQIASKSAKLMTKFGLITSTSNGYFTILPLAQRSVEKCVAIVDYYMKKVDAQKISVPILTSIDLWKKSGRYEQGQQEVLTTKNSDGKMYVLGPTYEEAVTSLIANLGRMSYKQLPLRLYQIGNKFREEQRPKHGLLRSKEFLMKDSYSFDIDRSSALKTYEEFSQIYKELFQAIGVTVTAVEANAGNIGGSLSHEYQIAAEIGEDEIVKCPSCAWSSNLELSGDITTCPKCQSQIERNRSIEVAHTFVLDDKYSKPLRATFQPANGKPSELMMGCYGIGITRLIAASVETLSTENEIRWPFALAPFSILIIPPKGGSHEEASAAHLTNVVYGELCKTVELSDDIVVDDRLGLTIGKRLLEARKMGYPMIIVIGKEAAGDDGKYEIHFTDSNVVLHLRLNDLLNEVNKKLKLHCFR